MESNRAHRLTFMNHFEIRIQLFHSLKYTLVDWCTYPFRFGLRVFSTRFFAILLCEQCIPLLRMPIHNILPLHLLLVETIQ